MNCYVNLEGIKEDMKLHKFMNTEENNTSIENINDQILDKPIFELFNVHGVITEIKDHKPEGATSEAKLYTVQFQNGSKITDLFDHQVKVFKHKPIYFKEIDIDKKTLKCCRVPPGIWNCIADTVILTWSDNDKWGENKWEDFIQWAKDVSEEKEDDNLRKDNKIKFNVCDQSQGVCSNDSKVVNLRPVVLTFGNLMRAYEMIKIFYK